MINLPSDDFNAKLDKELIKNGFVKVYKFGFEISRFIDSLKDSLEIDDKKLNDFKQKLEEFEQNELVNSKNSVADQLYLIFSISNRYQMIKELMRNEPNIKFGIWGLLFYLGLTCFDSLGQKVEFHIFFDWLFSKKNKDFKALVVKAKSLASFDLEEQMKQLYTLYLNDCGSKKSFHNFLDSISSKPSYSKLMSEIKLSDDIQQQLDNLRYSDYFKREWLYSFRNEFTHNAKNNRWDITGPQYTLFLNYKRNNKQFTIEVNPKIILESLLKCISDGLHIRYENVFSKL